MTTIQLTDDQAGLLIFLLEDFADRVEYELEQQMPVGWSAKDIDAARELALLVQDGGMTDQPM